ncbi:Protein of unknown function [Pyronema omphalodes CBS 100304]|uniref:Uncharacterized protein n=1 Tax=Pyronema omphalodes (strain CBS 100304) TaxID=1076935 RepID=U4L0Y2_PYROM|nr:Protein of unknown function [Pyronema omphalodes CBS 100304]
MEAPMLQWVGYPALSSARVRIPEAC